MTDQPERIVDEPTTERESGRDALTTADMAAATATVPARNRTDRSERSDATSTDNQVAEVGPLFNRDEADEFQSRWFAIQARFVDEPRQSVEEADQLVATVMKRLAEVFASERQNLEKDWGTGEDVSTEDLRVAFTRYRSFFDRLLSV
jgi:hypothetical protein